MAALSRLFWGFLIRSSHQTASSATRTLSSVSFNAVKNPQTIAVIGTGAVGGYYGARLHEAGHKVHFHMRGAHFEAAVNRGLQVTSIAGDMIVNPIAAYQSIEQMPTDVDWIIVALKSTSLEAIPELVRPMLSTKTKILVIMNGMIENALLSVMSKEDLEKSRCIYGGMAFICSNRIGPAEIDHSYYGLLAAGVAYGRKEAKEDDERAFLDLFENSAVQVSIESSLLRGRWKKMIWNLPFNGISVAMGGLTVDQIVTDPGLRILARRIMEETVAAANASVEARCCDQEPFGESDMAMMMKFSDEMGPYRTSTSLDFINRRPMEVRYLFREPLEEAKRMNVATPTLEAIVLQIEAYQRIYNLF